MNRGAYPSYVAIAEALVCMRDIDADRIGGGTLAKVHELLKQDPPNVQAAAAAAAVGAVNVWQGWGAAAEQNPNAWLLTAVYELLRGESGRSADSKPAAHVPASAPPRDDGEVFRLALGAVCEISALACTARQLVNGSNDENATAVALMMARTYALSEALCPVLDRASVDVAELRKLVNFTEGGAA